MHMKGISGKLPLLLLAAALFAGCAKESADDIGGAPAPQGGTPSANYDPMLPALRGSDELIVHRAYSLAYCEAYEQAHWVAYLLTREYATSVVDREDCFRPDSAVSTGSATPDDYAYSGYDIGHMAPAADMEWDYEVMRESFLMSNMSPQRNDFNAGLWCNMEKQVRYWAKCYDSLYVVTGPVLKSGLPVIGANEVAVPEMFYKIVLDLRRGQGLAFLTPHQQSDAHPRTFVTTIDEVEQITGQDFFAGLPDSIQSRLESSVCDTCWRWIETFYK